MAKGSTRRAKVIKAMVAFVIILALLTFFSNTLMNMTIPKVVGSYATRGNLSYSNNSQGYVKVENSTEVKGLKDREVESINVGEYFDVEPGDTLITLKSVKDSEELEDKRNTLKTLERDAEYEARKDTGAPDYSNDYNTIDSYKITLS